MQITVTIPDDKLLYLDRGIEIENTFRTDRAPCNRESYVQEIVARQMWARENVYVPAEKEGRREAD